MASEEMQNTCRWEHSQMHSAVQTFIIFTSVDPQIILSKSHSHLSSMQRPVRGVSSSDQEALESVAKRHRASNPLASREASRTKAEQRGLCTAWPSTTGLMSVPPQLTVKLLPEYPREPSPTRKGYLATQVSFSTIANSMTASM